MSCVPWKMEICISIIFVWGRGRGGRKEWETEGEGVMRIDSGLLYFTCNTLHAFSSCPSANAVATVTSGVMDATSLSCSHPRPLIFFPYTCTLLSRSSLNNSGLPRFFVGKLATAVSFSALLFLDCSSR